MPRKPPTLSPVDPGAGELSIDQLVADGVLRTAKEAMAFVGVKSNEFARLVRTKAFPSWKAGRCRVFPVNGLRAYLARQARQQGVGA